MIFVIKFLAKEFYIPVILIFSNGHLVTMETAERGPLKTCEKKTNEVVSLLSKIMLLNIVNKSMKGQIKIFFGQSKIHVRY